MSQPNKETIVTFNKTNAGEDLYHIANKTKSFETAEELFEELNECPKRPTK